VSAHTVAAAPSRHRAATVRRTAPSPAPLAPHPAADWARLVVATASRSVLVVLLGLAFWAAAPTLVGWHSTTTVTGSMEPRVRVGDVVVSKPVPTTDLRVGQVLLADDPDHDGRLRFHRFTEPGEAGSLVTKGDANPEADSSPVQPDAVRGVGMLRVPWIGLPVTWAREGDVARLGLLAASIAVLLALSTIDGALRRRVEGAGPDGGRAGVAGTSGEDLALGVATAASGVGAASIAGGTPRRVLRRQHRRARRRRSVAGGLSVVVAATGIGALLPAEAVAAPFRAVTSSPTSTLSTLSLVAPTDVRCVPARSGTASVDITWSYPSTEAVPVEFQVVATNGSTSTVLGTSSGTSRSFTYEPRSLLNLGSSGTITVRTVHAPTWTATSTTQGVSVRVSSLLGITNVSCGS